MATLITLCIALIVIYGGAIYCFRQPVNKQLKAKPSRKLRKQHQEAIEMLDYKLSLEYKKLKAV